MNDDAEIIQEFLVESHENLDHLDRDLVELERSPGSRELLSSVFRTIHTIKGTSGFLAFHRLESLTHVGENLLSRLRDGKMTMDAEVTHVLLSMVDTVRALLEGVERNGLDTDPAVDVDVVVAALQRVLDGEGAAAPVDEAESLGEAEPTAEEPEPAALADSEPQPQSQPEPEAVEAAPVAPSAPAPAASAPVPPAAAAVAEEAGDGAEKRGVVDSSVRVDIELLDSLVQLVGELVLTRNQILQRAEASDDIELGRAAQRLDLVASELQENVMRTRMQPMAQVWSKMPRIVRDLAHQLGREVELEMEGHDTELDRSLLEALKGPLTHLVRNALDHGLEPRDVRVAAGKSPAGHLHLRAYHESGQVVIEIADDGAGIDPVKIGEAAVSRGVITREAFARMEPREVLDLIFRAGFSTAAAVTNVSGRGVGMDVVRTNIERIGGSVDILSAVGSGTTCRVRIPLTLAIIPALVVAECGERYAIPQANLVELVRLEGQDLRDSVDTLAGAPVLRLRGRLLPLVSLGETLTGLRPETDALTVVVVQADDIRFGLCVAEVHDTQEIVVKPIGRQLKALPVYAGATIMGDGQVALILDVGGIARVRALTPTEFTDTSAVGADVGSQALLVLEVSNGRRAALPLTAVSRLEEFDSSRIERSGSSEVVQYRDGILRLLRLAPAIGLQDTPGDREQISVVVHEENGRRVGIVIDQVLDVVDEAIVATEVGRRAGVLGSAVVQDRVTDLVDLDAVVRPLELIS
ncbi:chemotaxis protein CheA [Nocardioides sp.]|uniref:chemotaxis protein CheA n=1 Tax=Nocardioides sp. TaxID=35761 RepID=UPI00286BCA04|nr:chemotaxis protein CheA [Nocardioides sp.]